MFTHRTVHHVACSLRYSQLEAPERRGKLKAVPRKFDGINIYPEKKARVKRNVENQFVNVCDFLVIFTYVFFDPGA